MTGITVYDPAMCCPTGVCGTEVDPKLARFSADLEWLTAKGVAVAASGCRGPAITPTTPEKRPSCC